MNFCMTVDVHDVITKVNFGDDQLRGLGVAGGQILAFPIDFDRRPYNTLALPCECVRGRNPLEQLRYTLRAPSHEELRDVSA